VSDVDGVSTDAEAEEVAPGEPTPERHGVPVTDSLGQEVLHPTREQYRDVVRALHDEGYLVCIDVTAVDYLAHPHRPTAPGVDPERFEVVAQFLDPGARRRTRLRVQVPVADPTIASIVDLHPGADALEREVFDLFGITFEGHPDLTRILMPEDWDGHPLRKDYAVGAIPVQFKGAGRERREDHP
jgi:NADH-quinone oxidoreductase subunit C